jgi:hypothetical protein
MKYVTETEASVAEKIRAAFENIERPGFDEIIFGNGEGRTDDLEAVQYLSGFRWQDLNLELLDEVRDVLPILTEKAFKYYLPAFLLAALDYVESDCIGDGVVSSLSPPPENAKEWYVTYYQDRFSGFTIE